MTARRPIRAPQPPHPDIAQRAITVELVRLTLGGRPDRPELQTITTRRDHPHGNH